MELEFAKPGNAYSGQKAHTSVMISFRFEHSIESTEVDLIYQVLKQAGEISNSKSRTNLDGGPPGITVDRSASGSVPGSSGSSGQSLNRRGPPPVQPSRAQGSSLCVVNPAPCSTSSGLSLITQTWFYGAVNAVNTEIDQNSKIINNYSCN